MGDERMTGCRTRRWVLGTLGCGVVGVAAALIGACVVSDYVFSPLRRPLQDYHTARLADPAAFGLTIRAFACCDGAVPALLVEPDPMAGPGERGRTVRRQLADQGLAVPPYGTVDGIVVLLHGRGGRKEDLLPVAERFVAAGFRCLLPDLPAHGESPLPSVVFGASDFERTLPRRALADARRRFGLPAEPAALWGLSMGGAFAIRAASDSPNLWTALVVVSSFDTLEAILTGQAARYVGPLGPLVTHALAWIGPARGAAHLATIRPALWAGRVTAPTLVVHGDHDRLIPITRGRLLFEALASPEKRWVQVAGGEHRGILATPAPLYAEMSAWLLRWTRARTNGRSALGHRAAPPRTPILPTTGSSHAA